MYSQWDIHVWTWQNPTSRRTARLLARWAILLLRDLFLHGPRRFQDFQESLTGVAPNTLSARLKALESQGVIARRLYSKHPPRFEYYLTEKGMGLGPVLKALKKWGDLYR